MKKFFSVAILALACVSSVFAGNSYNVEVNLSTQAVTIVQNGKVIRGKQNEGGALAVVELSKDGKKEIACRLKKVQGLTIPSFSPCTVKQDGSVSFYGVTYKSQDVKRAFRYAMDYLQQTDEPVSVSLYHE